MPIIPILRYVLLTARRDRFFLGILLAELAVVALSIFFGGIALVEQQTTGMVFMAAILRLLLAVGMIVFTCFFVRNAFDSREMMALLARPVTRTQVVLGYWCGLALLGLVLAVPGMLLVWLLGTPDVPGFMLWAVSLWLEGLLVISLGLFCAMALSSVSMAVMAALGLYLTGRIIGFFQATAQGVLHEASHGFDAFLQKLLLAVSVVFPRLDFFAHTEWLVYGHDNLNEAALLVVGQAAVFVPVLLLATLIDFRRKEF